MSLRYVDIYRIPVKDYTRRGKTYLSMLQVKELLTGVIEVEEKIDGKRLRVPVEDYILYKEHCRQVHTIRYSKLPAWAICFDIWTNGRFLDRDAKMEILGILGVPAAPILFHGETHSLTVLTDLIGSPSAYGAERIEGIVIKNPEKQLFGKIVDPLFDQEVDSSKHHLRRSFEMNRLDVTGAYINE